jgi:hypothetical protein
MDVSRVLGMVHPFFEDRGDRYALVGGLTLLAYGAPRATFDVDLLTMAASREALVAFLEGRGFVTLSLTPGFSNHQHPEPALGRLDVIYVSGATADAVLSGSARRSIAPGVEAPVPRAEHLVAMKAQAFAKDATRYSDLADLQFLLSLPGLDLQEARGYFEWAGIGEYFDEAEPAMRALTFDLGLNEEDVRALRAARTARRALDRSAALKLMADASPIVDAAVRRRPLFSGAPFTLPSGDVASDQAAAGSASVRPPPEKR